MFSKKFFSTVALSGATVSLVGSVSNVYSYSVERDFLDGSQYAVDHFKMSRPEFEKFRSNMELALEFFSDRRSNRGILVVSPKSFSWFEEEEKFFKSFDSNCLYAIVSDGRVKFFKVVGTDVRTMELGIDEVRCLLKMLENDNTFIERIQFKK